MILICLLFAGYPSEIFSADKFQFRGRVIDDETGAPIAAVNVFLANTTLGAATNEAGFFTIAFIPLGSYDLFINHIGYEIQAKRIDLFEKQKSPIEIRLTPRVLLGEKVEISARDLMKREQHLETFEREFIGDSQNARSCRLLNPRALDFSEEEDGALRATADSMLIVMNESLGYRLEIFLVSFKYMEKDIKYMIYPRFEEMTPKDDSQRERWIKNRKDTWEGSLRHFLSTLARDEYHQGVFEVFRGFLNPETGGIETYGIPIKSRRPQFIRDEPIEELKRMQFEEFLIVLYRDYTKMHGSAYEGDLGRFPTSYLEMTAPFATINIYGNYQPFDAFKVYGAWAAHRVADLLPMEYDPGEDKN